MREGRWTPYTDLLVLSARYGLVWGDTSVPYYEQRMTRPAARRLRGPCLNTLREILRHGGYEEVFVNVGKRYLEAISGWESLNSAPQVVEYAEGGIGTRLHQMKDWIDRRSRGEDIQTV